MERPSDEAIREVFRRYVNMASPEQAPTELERQLAREDRERYLGHMVFDCGGRARVQVWPAVQFVIDLLVPEVREHGIGIEVLEIEIEDVLNREVLELALLRYSVMMGEAEGPFPGIVTAADRARFPGMLHRSPDDPDRQEDQVVFVQHVVGAANFADVVAFLESRNELTMPG